MPLTVLSSVERETLMYQNYKKIVFPYVNKDGSVSWVVEYPDLPGCSAVGSTEEEALIESKVASELWLDEYFELHKSFPIPKEVSNNFSGRVLVRMPKTLHKELTLEAEEERVSLNSLIITLLAQNYGRRMTKPTFNITINQSKPEINETDSALNYQEKSEEKVVDLFPAV